MITPNKATPFKDSIIFKMTYILDEQFETIHLAELYKNTKAKFSGLDEYIYAIDTLYVLGRIELDMSSGEVKKC